MDPASPTTGIRWLAHDDGVGLITLSRPPVNALNWELKRALLALIADLRDDAAIRAIVIASDLPKTFCAGSDLYELSVDHGRPGSATERTQFEFEMWQALSALPQPSIAAVEGHALGSGLELSVACDFRVAGRAASFGLPEIKIGGAPGVQTLARLPYLVGLGAARRMLLLGDSLSAEDGRALGLVDEVTPAGEALKAALALARRLVVLPSSSIQFLKASLAAATDGALGRVGPVVMNGVEPLFLAPEMREGIRAFLDKRPPDFAAAVARQREATGS
jgi:enoyl-CoA hydratase/carnithine racemase